jgi:hypothetical protein
MTHHISGRLHWDTTHLATPAWMLFLNGQPGTAPTMLPGFDTSQPREASPAAVAHLIEQMLRRETGHLPQQVHVTTLADGRGYAFVATAGESLVFPSNQWG